MLEVRTTLRRWWAIRWGRAGIVTGGILLAWPLAAAILPDGAPPEIVLQGVVFGTVTALLAMGLILTYRTDKIINFAYAAIGGVGGVLAVNMFVEAGVNYAVAVITGLAVGLAVGGLVELLAIRRFTHSSRLITTVATIGLAQVLLGIQLYIPTRVFNASGLIGGFETPLSDTGFNLGVVRFNGNHMLIVAVVPVVIAALAWFLLKTDAGVAVRAAAENRDRALLLGIPIRRLTTIVWIVAGGLAALTFILKAPFAGGVATVGGPTALLPALAAAVIARMQSLPVAFAGGVGLGVLDQITFWNTQRATVSDVTFLIVILLALILQRNRFTRAEVAGDSTWSMAEAFRAIPAELRRVPEVRFTKWGLLAALAIFAVFVPPTWSVSSLNLATTALIWGMVAVSLVVLTGWGGNISLGQFAIVGVGGIVAANVVVRYNVDLFVTLGIAAAAGALAALVIGIPALRIRGPFLAATTLAFAVALDTYFLNPINFPEWVHTSLGRPVLWERWDLEEGKYMYWLCLGFLTVFILLAMAVRRARSGRVLVATRDNDRAASAAAVPITAVKLMGFLFAGVMAGIAGALFVFQIHGAGVGTFKPEMSLEVFSMAVIGGMSSIGGAITGVFGLRWLQQELSGELRLIVTGAGLLFILMVMPGGLVQPFFRLRDRLLRMVADRRGILVPSLLEDRRVGEGEEGEREDLAGVMAAAGGSLGGAEADDAGDGEGGGDGARTSSRRRRPRAAATRRRSGR